STNLLFETEHGPSGFDGPGGGDEVNILERGKNYGWPIIHHRATQAGMESPLLEYTPACAPASGMFYRGSAFPQFRGNFFFGCLRGTRLIRVALDGRRVAGQESPAAPADCLEWREAIAANNLEVAIGGVGNFAERVGFEAKQHFQKRSHQRWPHRQLQQVTTARNHPSKLTQSFVERHILQNSAGHNQIKTFIGKWQGQNVALRERN